MVKGQVTHKALTRCGAVPLLLIFCEEGISIGQGQTVELQALSRDHGVFGQKTRFGRFYHLS